MNLAELRALLKEFRNKAKGIIAKAENEKRSLNDDEIKELDSIAVDIEKREKEIEVREKLEGKLKEESPEPEQRSKNPEKLVGVVEVRENENAWKVDQSEILHLWLRRSNPRYRDAHFSNGKNEERYQDLLRKSAEKWEKRYTYGGQIVGTDSLGGYKVMPEFDKQIDTLMYKQSEFLDSINFRQGTEKTEINSMGQLTYTDRTDENTEYTSKTVSYSQEELKMRDTGGIVGISNRLLDEPDVNILDDLMEAIVDADITYFENRITTGKAGVQMFNGVWFTTGIGSVTAKNDASTGGTGKLVSQDLTAMHTLCPAQTDYNFVFLMDKRERALFLDARDNNGRPLDEIIIVNGKFYHRATGARIITINNMDRTLNGVTANTGGTDIPVIGGNFERIRIYKQGGRIITMSSEAGFTASQTLIKIEHIYKMGIPTNSKSSFVICNGLKYNVA